MHFEGKRFCYLPSKCLKVVFVTLCSFSDFAKILGCLLGLNEEVTAITFVTLGTSLIDVFATRKAAALDPTADNSLGNVIAANAITVFLGFTLITLHHSVAMFVLGLGLPWLITSVYWETVDPGVGFRVEARGLEFAIILYLILSVISMKIF